MPDWNHVHAELRRRGVTLLLLWEEYRGQHPDGYGYSRFCDLYIDWRRGVSATMRQTHVGGEKLFVDYAGDTVPVFDGATGEERERQDLRRRAWGLELHLCGGPLERGAGRLDRRPRQCARVPRRRAEAARLRQSAAGVTAACRYEPGINRTYQEMAAHYGTAVLPTRPRKPRDKAKVEVAVLIVERLILARLRNRRFFSLGELNEAIARCSMTSTPG